jgi:glycine/D-amino acid oxidase-like deaminating enzyme
MTVAGDVVIVGAGIVGAACALECVRAGLRTTVVEALTIGGGATAAGMGHIVVMDDSPAQFALTSYSQRLWDELAEQLPPEVQWHRSGTLWVAADQEEMAEVQRKHQYYTDRSIAVEVLDASALTEAEPQLREGLAGGLRVPGDAVVYPPCAARYLLNRALEGGATCLVGAPARQLAGTGVHLADDRFLAAGAVVNATGAWANDLTPGWPVKKRKGHLLITDRYPGFVRHQLVELGYLKSAHSVTADSVAFNVQPRPNGQLLIGSSRQFGAEDGKVDQPILNKMLARACEYLPGLGRLSAIRAWTGFRAATPDKLPLIGPCPITPGLWLATGHEGLGITTSLATAKLLVDQLLDRKPAIPWEPYWPERALQGAEHAAG